MPHQRRHVQQGPRYDHNQKTNEQPSAQRIILDEFNSDLNFNISSDGVTGASSHQNGFEYMWAGCRATHGIREGKVIVKTFWACIVLLYQENT